MGYYSECGISHVMPNCPYKPTSKPKKSPKFVEVSLASSGHDNSQKMIPMNVVTRAQKLKDAKVQIVDEERPKKSSKNSWKA